MILAFSIVWLLLAVTVTLFAMRRRAGANGQDQAEQEHSPSGNALVFLAAIYSLALLAGFLYVGRFLVSSL